MTIAYSIRKYPRRLAPLDHYLLAPYGSTEQHFQHIIVIDPAATEPTYLMRPRTRKPKPQHRLALVLPKLNYLTSGLATDYTRITATYWWLRTWTPTARSQGNLPLHTPPTYEIRSTHGRR